MRCWNLTAVLKSHVGSVFRSRNLAFSSLGLEQDTSVGADMLGGLPMMYACYRNLDMPNNVVRLDDLSKWNDEGRLIAAHNSSQITEFHLGLIDAPQLLVDNRSEMLARTVLNRVIDLNIDGRSEAARDAFDPSHAPFVPIMEAGQAQGLSCVSVLGHSEYLVLQGTSYSERKTWHIANGDAYPLGEALRAFAWSRNRQHFVIAHEDGTITIRRSLQTSRRKLFLLHLLPASFHLVFHKAWLISGKHLHAPSRFRKFQ